MPLEDKETKNDPPSVTVVDTNETPSGKALPVTPGAEMNIQHQLQQANQLHQSHYDQLQCIINRLDNILAAVKK